MAQAEQDITFAIPGELLQATRAGALPSDLARGTVKASVRVGAQRGSGAPVRVTARTGQDVVKLTIANGPTLFLHPESARDLMHAQAGAGTRSAVVAGAAGEVIVPPQLGWPGLEGAASRGATRGWMGQALLSVFEVVTGVLKDPAVTLATTAATKALDGRVETGVYQLSADAAPKLLKTNGHRLIH